MHETNCWLLDLAVQKYSVFLDLSTKIQLTKMLVTCQGFGELFLFELVGQYSTNQNQYNKGRFKVMATYLQQ